jgi:hypothetical protein
VARSLSATGAAIVSTALVERAEVLIRDYLQDAGCPCGFPRLRSVVKRDTARSLGVLCRALLVHLYEAKVPRIDIRAAGPSKETGAEPLTVDYLQNDRCAKGGYSDVRDG